MECGCTVSVDVDSYSTTIADETRTARKTHKCGECRREIQPGEKYEHYRGVCEGDIFTAKTCPDCVSLRKEFFKRGFCFEMLREDLREFIREANGQIGEECLARVTPRAREYVCSIIDEIWEDYWLDNPTQPAVRLERLQRDNSRWNWPGWVHYRSKEMAVMDNAVTL